MMTYSGVNSGTLMWHIRFSFFLLCILTATGCGSPPNELTPEQKNQLNLQQAFEVARLTREDPQQTTFPEAKKNLREIIPEISVGNDLSTNIQLFLKQSLGLNIQKDQIQVLDTGPASSLSGNQVFRVLDTEGRSLLAVKVYPYPWSETSGFLRELSAFDLTALIIWKWMTPVQVKALGQCRIEDKEYALAALSYARGRNLHSLVLDLLSKPVGTLERFQTLQSIKPAFERFGRALAELHQKQWEKESYGSLRASLRHEYQAVFAAAYRNLHELDGDIERSKLKAYFDALVNQMEKQRFRYRYVHGQARLLNFFYDQATETITMIDLGSLSHSIGNRGQPIGVGAVDYLMFTDDLSLNQLIGLGKDEYSSLLLAFQMGYFQAGGTAPTPVERKFGELLARLQHLSTKAADLKNLPPSVAKILDSRIAYEISVLQNSLSESDLTPSSGAK